MKRSALFLIIGLLIGAIATAYFLGSPRSRSLPGSPLRPPDRNPDSSGTVAVSIDEKFFDSLLGTIFQKLGSPQLKLSQNQSTPTLQAAAFQSSCNNVLELLPDGSNTKTGVRFTGGKI